jgi:predicted transposase/invertase (TIGR01784 family)
VRRTRTSSSRRYDIPPVYSFNILDYNAPEFMGREECFWAVHLKDNLNRIFSKKIILFFMELTKFAAQFPDKKSPAYKWGYALKHMSGMLLKDMPEEAGEFRKLFEICQLSKLTTMEKQEYEKSVLEYEDVKEAMEYHHRMGRTEGFEKGYGLGVEKGIEQGVQQGREALLQTARNFLDLGVSLADVAKATGLSKKEILAHVDNAGD